MIFVLFAYVPEPSLAARVRHRLFAQVQRRFADEKIEIPLPRHELRVQSMQGSTSVGPGVTLEVHRVDGASLTPPTPKVNSPVVTAPRGVEECHRGVDE